MSKAYFEKEIQERAEELGDEGLDNALAIGLLSLSSYASAARSSMLSQHLVQTLVPTHPEVPGVSTGREMMMGENSTGYYETDEKLKVIRKIEKFPDFSYTLLTFDPKSEEYGIINREVLTKKAEEFGYLWNNTEIDSYKVGSTIPKNTVLYKSPSFDEYGNFRYGVNAKVAYVISQETIEDAIVVSESFAKKLSTTYVETCTVTLNDNDIPLNLYGDGENYKSFPDIGERTKDNIIFGSRKRNKVMDQYTMKNSNLRKIFPSDDIYQMPDNYFIGDVNIWFNKQYNEFPESAAYAQVKKYYDRIHNYYTDIYEYFGEIIESGAKYSKEFSDLYSEAKNALDPACKYADDDGKIFSNIIMEFSIYKFEKLRVGSKCAGRYGNKSVVSKVLPDSQMGITDEGVVPDVRCDALGVLGRLNSGQLIEQELSLCADAAKKQIDKATSLKEKKELLFKFLDIASPDQSSALKVYLSKMDDNEQLEWFNKMDRIILIESPIYCASTKELAELVETFKPHMSTVYYKNEDGELNPAIRKMIVADEYFIRLKQEPVTKFSVRSKGMNNPRSSLPIKSTQAAKHKRVFADQANRIGKPNCQVV